MTILQTIATRKPLKRKDLSPGNGGGTPYFFGQYSSRNRVCRVSIGMATPLI
jgi:hypothetical protein